MKMAPSGCMSLGTGNTRNLRSFGERLDGVGFAAGMRARRIAGPPGRSVAKVGVDPFAEFTAAPCGRVPVKDPQHVPGFGGPGAERIEVVQF